MVLITHSPATHFYNNFLVEVSNIEEALEVLIPKIRLKSQEFYRDNIKNDLERNGTSLIDVHAGNGCYYSIVLKP